MLYIYYSFSRLWENRLIPPPSWRSNKRGVKLSQERNVECFGCMHRSGITRSYGNSSSYYFLNHCTYVHDGYSQYVRVPLYLHPCQPFFIHWFVHISILTRVRWNLIIVLIFTSLILKMLNISLSINQPFWISSFEDSVQSDAPFWIELFIFLMISFLSSLCMPNINCLSEI